MVSNEEPTMNLARTSNFQCIRSSRIENVMMIKYLRMKNFLSHPTSFLKKINSSFSLTENNPILPRKN